MRCHTLSRMVNAVKSKPAKLISIRPTAEDQKLVHLLHKKLGVDTSQLFRLAIRLLATKEGVTA
jgi:hypothetical protein